LSLVFGLRAEFRVGQFDRYDRGQAFAHIVTGQLDLLFFQRAGAFGIIVQRPGQGRAEGRQMGAAVALRDIVGEAENILVIAVVPLQCDVDDDIVAVAVNGDRLWHQRRLVTVEILNKGSDSAFVKQVDFLYLFMPCVAQYDVHATVQEGELAVTVLQLFKIKFGNFKRGRRRKKSDSCALFYAGCIVRRRGVPDDFQRAHGIPEFEAHIMLFAVAPDVEFQPFGQSVDHRYADAVQTAGHLVRIVVGGILELAASVELGHDDLCCRDAFLAVHAGRDTAPVVLDRDAAVGVEGDQDQVAMTGEGLVDRIVRYLEHHMVQAAAIIGVTDIHAGPLADRVQALENLDRIRAIFILIGRFGSIFRHFVFADVIHAATIAAGAGKPKENVGFRDIKIA